MRLELFTSSHLISSHLISSHLISSHLISSHLISSHLFSSLLFSIFSYLLFSSLLFSIFSSRSSLLDLLFSSIFSSLLDLLDLVCCSLFEECTCCDLIVSEDGQREKEDPRELLHAHPNQDGSISEKSLTTLCAPSPRSTSGVCVVRTPMMSPTLASFAARIPEGESSNTTDVSGVKPSFSIAF